MLNILFSTLTVVIFGIVLAIYSWKIFLIFILFSLAYIGWVKLFMRKRADLNRKNFEQMSVNQNNLMQLIYGMQDIKLLGCEQQKRWEWENIQASLFRINMSSLNLGAVATGGGRTYQRGEKNTDNSPFSHRRTAWKHHVGRNAFHTVYHRTDARPISQFVSFMQDTQDAQLSLERLGEIHGKPDEETEGMDQDTQISGKDPIQLNNVVFTYGSEKSKRIIKGLSLDIPAGKTTAIVGLSGSGKTTLIKLMLGFYPPTGRSGDDRQSVATKISFKEWRKHCGVVMQEGFIFGDTIANNIVPDGNMIDKERLLYAVEMANIREFIESLPLKYNTKIGNTGQGLSQGETAHPDSARHLP